MTQAFNLALLANNVNTSGQINADSAIYNTVNVANGGTNISSTPTNGQLLIGDGTGYSLATLTAGTGISISNSAGGITVANANPNAVVDIQTFNSGDADLTWDKPTSGQTMCKIQVWAAGGGGARSTISSPGAGGGGSYNEIVVPISYMGATASILVGAAGLGRTGSSGVGTAGGNSIVPISNYPTGSINVSAYGGGGASSTYGGGGGGLVSAGIVGVGGLGFVGVASNVYATDPTSGGAGSGYLYTGSGCTRTDYPAQGSIYGGGGGGGGNIVNTSPGGNTMFGGGGGANGTRTVGTSNYGGAGGNGSTAATVPAGGGGSSSTANTNGSNGAAGRVVIISF